MALSFWIFQCWRFPSCLMPHAIAFMNNFATVSLSGRANAMKINDNMSFDFYKFNYTDGQLGKIIVSNHGPLSSRLAGMHVKNHVT